MWIDQHLSFGLDDSKNESIGSACSLQKLLFWLNFGLHNDVWIEAHMHIFGTLYHRDMSKSTQFHLVHLPYQAHLDFESVLFTDLVGRQIFSQIIKGDCWWDIHYQLPDRVTIVPVICASDQNQLTSSSSGQHSLLLYLTSCNIQKFICGTPKKCPTILIGLICHSPKCAKNTDEACHSMVATVLSPLRNLDITGPGLKWNYADGFQRQCYPLLAVWVGNYPEQVMIAQVSYSSCLMCEISEGAPMGHSTFHPIDN